MNGWLLWHIRIMGSLHGFRGKHLCYSEVFVALHALGEGFRSPIFGALDHLASSGDREVDASLACIHFEACDCWLLASCLYVRYEAYLGLW